MFFFVNHRIIIPALEVVDIMKEGFTANSAAPIYDECYIIWSGFQEVSMEHLNREANQVAHELARRAMITKKNCIWDDDPPNFILHTLANDVTILNQ